MLSNLDDQRAMWSQIRAFRWGGSRGQREEEDASPKPPRVTEAEGDGYLEPAVGPDQKPGAVGVTAISDPSLAPLHWEGAERGSTGTRRVASAASGTWAAALGVPPGAAQGMIESGGGGDLLGGPQPHRGERQPAARGEGAAAPLRVATESGGGREQANPPLVEEPPSKGGRCSAEEAARREGAQRGHNPGPGREIGGATSRGEEARLRVARLRVARPWVGEKGAKLPPEGVEWSQRGVCI